MQHNGETCECHLAVPLYTTLLLKQQIIRRLSLCRPSINRPTVYCLLYYTILSCPALSSVPPHTHTHMHTYVFGTAWFLAARVLDTPLRARQVATVSVAQMSGLLQLHLNRGCTALAPQAWIGLDGGVGLGCRASERAKRLSYCAARLASLSLSHHCILCPLSTFKFLLTGSPRQFQPAFPPLLPGLNSVICSLPLSPLST